MLRFILGFTLFLSTLFALLTFSTLSTLSTLSANTHSPLAVGSKEGANPTTQHEIILDTFTDTSGTSLFNHFTNLNQAWQVMSGGGTPTIDSNGRLICDTTLGNTNMKINAWTTAVDARLQVYLGTDFSARRSIGILFRYFDQNNYLYLRLTKASASDDRHLELLKRENGTLTLIATGPDKFPGDKTYTIRVVTDNAVVSGYVNGTLEITGNVQFAQTNTYVGVRFDSGAGTTGTGWYADSFDVYADQSPSTLFWAKDFESNSISEWEYDGDGSFANSTPTPPPSCSGTAGQSTATSPVHGGVYSMKESITGASAGCEFGARAFRNKRPDKPLYYSAWLNVPQLITLQGSSAFWNIWQYKAKLPMSTTTEVMWALYVVNQNGNMYLRLTDKTDYWAHGGPIVNYDQTTTVLPVATWTHVEVYYLPATDLTGVIQVWQDDMSTPLFNLSNKVTTLDFPVDWSINMYAASISPSNADLYVDDVKIGTTFIP